jgi:hypothetical protein
MALTGFMGAYLAEAKPMHIEALMSPKQQILMNFEDGTKHFVLFVKREGVSKGDAPLADAQVTENGMHDIIPGVSGDPRGYLAFTLPGGESVYVKWRVRAIFVPAGDGKSLLLDNGYWEIISGTGKLAGLKGAGTLHIKAAGPADRQFILDGEVTGS